MTQTADNEGNSFCDCCGSGFTILIVEFIFSKNAYIKFCPSLLLYFFFNYSQNGSTVLHIVHFPTVVVFPSATNPFLTSTK